MTAIKNYFTLTIPKKMIFAEDLKTQITANAYSNIYKLLQEASTIRCQRSLTPMGRIKHGCDIQQLGFIKFNDVSIINIEKDLVQKVNNKDIIS